MQFHEILVVRNEFYIYLAVGHSNKANKLYCC
jgi:hypothetical protein